MFSLADHPIVHTVAEDAWIQDVTLTCFQPDSWRLAEFRYSSWRDVGIRADGNERLSRNMVVTCACATLKTN
jgi:hypothetical protein